jgi:hypothetical protein
MLRDFPVCFQWVTLDHRCSARHARDMKRKSFLSDPAMKQGTSNFLVCSTELDRLGEFEKVQCFDREAIASADHELRIKLLGIDDLRNRKKNPRHRPASVDTALKCDRIVQAVLFETVTNFEKPMKQIIGEVGDRYEVKPRRVYRCIEETPIERRKEILESIITTCLWPYAMMLMHGVSPELISEDPRGRWALAVLGKELTAKT